MPEPRRRVVRGDRPRCSTGAFGVMACAGMPTAEDTFVVALHRTA